MIQCKYIYFCLLFTISIILVQGEPELWNLQNLNDKCLDCICEAATECDVTRQCVEGYCGPFKVAKLYWLDTGNVTLPLDDGQRAGAYEDCANNYHCAKKIVKVYFTRFGKDCNRDGVTDCYDYMMLNFNGGWNCHKPLEEDLRAGIHWVRRYNECMERPDESEE